MELASQLLTQADNDERKLIGGRIKLKLARDVSDDETVIEGWVYAMDAAAGVLIIYEDPSASDDSLEPIAHNNQRKKQHNFRIIKTSSVKELMSFEQPQPKSAKGKSSTSTCPMPFSDTTQNLPQVKMAALKQREEESAYDRQRRLGNNVTFRAQNIFDALSKTLPCRWDQTTIVVMDEVRIKSPYTVENCSGGNNVSLNRVKKVLQGELDKMKK